MSADIWPSILLMCHISFANLYRLNHPCFLGWILIYLVHPVDSEKKKIPGVCVTIAALLSLLVLTFSCCLISYFMSQKLAFSD